MVITQAVALFWIYGNNQDLFFKDYQLITLFYVFKKLRSQTDYKRHPLYVGVRSGNLLEIHMDYLHSFGTFSKTRLFNT